MNTEFSNVRARKFARKLIMQALLEKVLPSKSNEIPFKDTDERGFDLADSLEEGESHELMVDYFKPQTSGGLFILRRSLSTNDWTLISHRSAEFIMRASMDAELESHKFEHEFDGRVLSSQATAARLRVGVYLTERRVSEGTNPTVVMVSDASRTSWKAFKVVCDSCRYKRRRSSFTEGVEGCWSPSSGSPCSYTCRPSHSEDFRDISAVIPSGQLILRMSHVLMQINGSAFTKLNVEVPAQGKDWCPIAHPGLLERTNTPDILVESRLPVWSERLGALALEFKQREVLPSRRNFQLVDNQGQSIVCMHYRTGKNEYTLELFPGSEQMSLMQAFCVAISSSLWH